MRPFFNRESLWAYPVFAAAGGSFGYWLTGVDNRADALLRERRDMLVEKRRRRAEREGRTVEENVQAKGVHPGPVGTAGGQADLI